MTVPPEHCRLVRLYPAGAVSVIVYVDDGPVDKPLMTCGALTLVSIENGGAPVSAGAPKPVPVNANVPLLPTTVLLIVIESSTSTGIVVERLAQHFAGDPGAERLSKGVMAPDRRSDRPTYLLLAPS